MNEVAHYPGFSEYFKTFLQSYFGKGYKIHFALNNTLDRLVKELELKCKKQICPPEFYVPRLKVDIVFAIDHDSFKTPRLILIEAKLLQKLSLIEVSQLVGYLQVGRTIGIGLLLLIEKGDSDNRLSGDLQEIILLKKLPMHWRIQLKDDEQQTHFNIGMLHYTPPPTQMIHWIDTSKIHGISSFEMLIEAVKKNEG
jgi:hypothetical protein